jgi:glutaredoxin
LNDSEVLLFTTPNCPHCRTAREYLSRTGVSFTEYDVSADQSALRRMLALSGRAAVPTIAACGEVMVGFDAAWLDEMLAGLKNRPSPGGPPGP